MTGQIPTQFLFHIALRAASGGRRCGEKVQTIVPDMPLDYRRKIFLGTQIHASFHKEDSHEKVSDCARIARGSACFDAASKSRCLRHRWAGSTGLFCTGSFAASGHYSAGSNRHHTATDVLLRTPGLRTALAPLVEVIGQDCCRGIRPRPGQNCLT